MSSAKKNDVLDKKPDLSLLPKIFKEQVAYGMMAGAQKYGRNNYLEGHSINQLIAAAERHLDAIKDGEDIDQDTTDRVERTVYHAALVCTNMLMLLHQQQVGTLKDDRFYKEDQNER